MYIILSQILIIFFYNEVIVSCSCKTLFYHLFRVIHQMPSNITAPSAETNYLVSSWLRGWDSG